jgi:hypothetical protein
MAYFKSVIVKTSLTLQEFHQMLAHLIAQVTCKSLKSSFKTNNLNSKMIFIRE